MRIRLVVWAALALEVIGFGIDAVFHGAVDPHFEGTSRSEMLRHLQTVHLVFFLGVAALALSTAAAFATAVGERRGVGLAALALAGALIQVWGQSWDVYAHMRLSHGPPIAWAMIVAGPILTAAAMLLARPRPPRVRDAGPDFPARRRY
jgi:hypothetical protein